MSKTEESCDLAFVSEVSVGSDLSENDIISTLRKLCLGTHQTVSEALNKKAKDCIIVGKIVAIKTASSLNAIQKLIVREVTPDGCSGTIFALFVLGKVSKHLKQFSLKVDDMLVIHRPEISKSCLINFLNMQSHAYELQAIVSYSSESKGNQSPHLLIQLIRSKVPDVLKDVVEQNSKDSAAKENSLHETENNTKANTDDGENPQNPTRRLKRILKYEEYLQLKAGSEIVKVPKRRFYTKLREITAKCTKVNIMGVIISVEAGCQCMEKKEHLLIYLQDENSAGKDFVLNLGSCKSEIPPLHKTYVLRALNVLILQENNEVTGWVKTGMHLATVDSDCEKPIGLLTHQENSTLSEEEEERIMELRNFVKTSISMSNLQHQSDESCANTVSENCSKIVTGDSVNDEEEDLGLILHLDSTPESEQLETSSLASEETVIYKDPETENCPSVEVTNCSESSSLPMPDVGTDAEAMQAMWKFFMEC